MPFVTVKIALHVGFAWPGFGIGGYRGGSCEEPPAASSCLAEPDSRMDVPGPITNDGKTSMVTYLEGEKGYWADENVLSEE